MEYSVATISIAFCERKSEFMTMWTGLPRSQRSIMVALA